MAFSFRRVATQTITTLFLAGATIGMAPVIGLAAQETLQQVEQPKDYEAVCKQAIDASNARDYPLARKYWQQALDLAAGGQQRGYVEYAIGKTFSNEGNYPQARVWLQKVIAEKDAFDYAVINSYLGISSTYLQEKNYDESRKAAEPVLQLPTAKVYNRVSARQLIANAYYNLNQFDECIQTLQDILDDKETSESDRQNAEEFMASTKRMKKFSQEQNR